MANQPTQEFVGQTVNGRYYIGDYASGGSFGAIHFGVDKRTDEPIAVKFERTNAAHPQLMLEFYFYEILSPNHDSTIGFMPRLMHFGPMEPGYHVLVMQRLGPSLLGMMRTCDGTFSITTTTLVLFQLFNIIDYVHQRRLLYRDVKPENFLIGMPHTDQWCTVFLIDLGFCKSYQTEECEHIPEITNKPVAGTVRYMSINNHEGREVSRRDDLESLMYLAVYMFKHQLPWDQGPSPVASPGSPTAAANKNKQICECKKHCTPEQLMVDMPPQYCEIMTTIRALHFQERPPYRRLMSLLDDVLHWLGISRSDKHYDWDRAHNPVAKCLRS